MVSLRAWPLHSHLELAARPEAVRPARQHARATIGRWRLDALADTAELLVSELVTNAVLASAGQARPTGPTDPTGPADPTNLIGRRAGAVAPRIRFWLASDRRRLMIHVWDPDRHRPVSRDTWPDGETGRGLLLVDALSAQWGCYSPDGRSGKIVWALCAP